MNFQAASSHKLLSLSKAPFYYRFLFSYNYVILHHIVFNGMNSKMRKPPLFSPFSPLLHAKMFFTFNTFYKLASKETLYKIGGKSTRYTNRLCCKHDQVLDTPFLILFVFKRFSLSVLWHQSPPNRSVYLSSHLMTEGCLQHIISWSSINKGLVGALPMCTLHYNFSLSSRKDRLCVHFAPSEVQNQRLLTWQHGNRIFQSCI